MKTIDLKQIRSLISATKAGLETTDTQTGFDAWMDSFGQDQLPRLIESLQDLVTLAQAVADDSVSVGDYFRIANR